MMPYEQDAIELLQKTEKVYQGTNRLEMKKAFSKFIEHTQHETLEDCPFYMGLVVISAFRMLDECPDYS